jgi:chromosome segregation ATPase
MKALVDWHKALLDDTIPNVPVRIDNIPRLPADDSPGLARAKASHLARRQIYKKSKLIPKLQSPEALDPVIQHASGLAVTLARAHDDHAAEVEQLQAEATEPRQQQARQDYDDVSRARDELAAEVERLRAQVTERDGLLRQANSSCDEARRERDQKPSMQELHGIRVQLEHVQTQLQSHEDELALRPTEQAYLDLSTQLEQSKAAVQTLQNNLALRPTEEAHLGISARLDQANATVQTLQNDLVLRPTEQAHRDLRNQLEEKNLQLQIAQQDFQNKSFALRVADERIVSMSVEHTALTMTIEHIKQERISLMSDVVSRDARLQRLPTEAAYNQLKRELKDAQNDTTFWEDRYKALEAEQRTPTPEATQLPAREKSVYEKDIEALKERVKRRDESLRGTREESGRLMDTIQSLQDSARVLQDEVQTLRNDLANTTAKLKDANEAAEKMRAVEAGNTKNMGDLKDAEEKITALEQEKTALSQDKEALGTQVNEVQEELQAANELVSQLSRARADALRLMYASLSIEEPHDVQDFMADSDIPGSTAERLSLCSDAQKQADKLLEDALND